MVDGAFYCMKKCETDGIDVTNSITDVELPYFFSEKYKHKIPLELTDKEYKRYFLKWLKLQSSLGIINQVTFSYGEKTASGTYVGYYCGYLYR